MTVSIWLIVISFNIAYISSSESDYNNNLLPYVKRKFSRIDRGNGLESQLFKNVDRHCVLNLLELRDDGQDYSNTSGEYLNLRNDAINKAFEMCTEERKFVMTQEQMQQNLINHKNAKYSEKIDCLKLEYSTLDPGSKLLQDSNLIFNRQICNEALEDFKLELMKGFNDYKNRIVKSYNLSACNLTRAMTVGRKIALRYVIMANGNFANNDIMMMRHIFVDDAERIIKELIKCFVLEMKNGNFGISQECGD